MNPDTVLTLRGGRVEVPEGYYIIPDNEKCQTGDLYYHYASQMWQRTVDFRPVVSWESAVCRSKLKFKNVVIIE